MEEDPDLERYGASGERRAVAVGTAERLPALAASAGFLPRTGPGVIFCPAGPRQWWSGACPGPSGVRRGLRRSALLAGVV